MELFTFNSTQNESVILSIIENDHRTNYWTSETKIFTNKYRKCIALNVCRSHSHISFWTNDVRCIEKHASICYREKEIPAVDVASTTIKADDDDYDC